MTITRIVSKIGSIKRAEATEIGELINTMFEDGIISINLITKQERIKPITIEPVSPIKILDGNQLKYKNATIPLASIMDNRLYVKSSIKKNETPKNERMISAIDPARPSIPSIRLYAFVNDMMINIDTDFEKKVFRLSNPSNP